MTAPLWFRQAKALLSRRRELMVIEGDTLPTDLPPRQVVLASENGEQVCVGMRCPCGCGYRIQLAVFDGASPRWHVTSDRRGLVTLHPSIHIKRGCRSHFWLRAGKVVWCD